MQIIYIPVIAGSLKDAKQILQELRAVTRAVRPDIIYKNTGMIANLVSRRIDTDKDTDTSEAEENLPPDRQMASRKSQQIG